MKQFFLIWTALLMLQMSVFAQTERPSCPPVSITGPSSVTSADSGERMIFTVLVENLSEKSKIEYVWSVSAGKIIFGQGSPKIEVDVQELGNTNVTATVKIKGLPEDCLNTLSETGPVSRIIDNCLDGYGKIPFVEEAGRLDNFIVQLRNSPDFLISFNLRFVRKPTAKQIDARINRIIKHFAFRKSLNYLNRIIFVISENGEEYTGVCYIGLDDKDTNCDDCKIIKGADIDVSKYSKPKKRKK